jgi:hypothetical protein
MPGLTGRTLAAGLAIPAVLIAVTACASSAPSSSTGSPSDSATGSASAYFNCLRQHGVSGFGQSSGSSSSAVSAARQACASLRPSGGFGGFGGSGGSSAFSADLQKFESCLSAHGVKVPSSSSGAEGFRSLFGELRDGTSAEQAAFSACSSDLPFGGGGGGFGGGGFGGGGGNGSGGGGTTA